MKSRFLFITALLFTTTVIADPGIIKLQETSINASQNMILENQKMVSLPTAAGEFQFIVQPLKNFSASDLDEIKAIGVSVIGIIPPNAYIVMGSKEEIDLLANKFELIYTSEYLPEYKTAKAFVKSFSALSGKEETVRIRAAASTFTAELLQHLGSITTNEVKVIANDPPILEVTLKDKDILELPYRSDVLRVHKRGEYTYFNDVVKSNILMNVNFVHDEMNLKGKGVIVSVADSGLDSGSFDNMHPDFQNKKVTTVFAENNKRRSWSDLLGHGTHVCGSICGTGAASDGQYCGTAPEADLYFICNGNASSFVYATTEKDLEEAYDYGARLNSNSWGNGSKESFGMYDSDSELFDTISFNHPDFLILFAVGNGNTKIDLENNTTISPQASAKNVLAVGASETHRPDIKTVWKNMMLLGESLYREDLVAYPANGKHQGMAAFSSRGPTHDGRNKPDIVAPGTMICSAESIYDGVNCGERDSYYTSKSGTSMAAPLVAGSAAVVIQYLREHGITNPSSALVKAVLLNGTRSMGNGQFDFYAEIPNKSPNWVNGFGHLDLANSLAPTNASLIVIEGVVSNTDDLVTYCFDKENDGNASITLVWTDPPATPGAGVDLINDLDLQIETKEHIFFANGEVAHNDAINNCETFRKAQLAAQDNIEIRVHGYNIMQGPQKFALAISGMDNGPIPEPCGVFACMIALLFIKMKKRYLKLFIFTLALSSAMCFAANEPIKPEGEGTKASPYRLTRLENLVWMGQNIAECNSNVFLLDNDIDAYETASWDDGFVEIGSKDISRDGEEHSFCGVLDGQNHAIKNLSYSKYGSLIYKISGAIIKNLRLENLSCGDKRNRFWLRGGLSKYLSESMVTNVHVGAIIYGYNQLGGIAADAKNSKIYNCSFIGSIYEDIGNSIIGGIVGNAENCDLRYCKAHGLIEAGSYLNRNYIGGVCGQIIGKSFIRYSCADMKIKAGGYIGGITSTAIENREYLHGHVITNDYGVMQCYSTCSADTSPDSVIGGICALTWTNCVCFSSYYDVGLMQGTAFGTGVSSKRLKRKATFKQWDFNKIWAILEDETTPFFRISEENTYGVCVISSLFGKVEIKPPKNKFAYGETVIINAVPADSEKTVFVGYSGDLTESKSKVILTLEKDLLIKADFAKLINKEEELNKLGSDKEYPLSGNYVQTRDFDMRNAPLKKPLGEYDTANPYPFTGIYDGQNHFIDNLVIDWTNYYPYASLFSCTYAAKIQNVRMKNAKLSTKNKTNGSFLIGMANNTQISNCYVEGRFGASKSKTYSGSICGEMACSDMIRCGFKGEVWINGTYIGGLTGISQYSTISESFAEMYDMLDSNEHWIAGLAVRSRNTSFVNCYVKGMFNSYVFVHNYGDITFNDNLMFSNCYANVNESSGVFGSQEYFHNCYFNSNYVVNAGPYPLNGFVSEEEMKKQETYVGWDFENVWDIEEGVGTPYFRYALPEPVGMFALLLLALMAVRKR